MSYLNLNRDKILPALQSVGVNVVGPIAKGQEIHFNVSYNDEPDALLVFYYKANGTTSISTSRGANKLRSEELASIIYDNCIISAANNISLYLSNVCIQDFEDSLNYLLTECDVKINSEKDINGGKQYQLLGPQRDKVTLKYFSQKQAMQVQGKPLFVYADLMEILCELLPYEKIVRPQLEAVKIDCSTSEILNELKAALPNTYDFLHEKTKAIISPSLALRRVNIELEDYTAFVMPALRGLEAYIKQLFLSKGINVGHKGFGAFLTGNNPAILNSQTKMHLGCPKVVGAIENSYRYWSTQRHGLFHVDGNISTSRILTRTEADQILTNVFQIIEESHALI